MSLLIYFAGLLIGVSVFLYIYSTIAEKTQSKAKNISKAPASQKIIKTDGNISFNKRPPLPPGTRVCPLCGSSLTKYEGLYATKIKQSGIDKLLIMGCRYCYKEDEDPLKPKKSSL